MCARRAKCSASRRKSTWTKASRGRSRGTAAGSWHPHKALARDADQKRRWRLTRHLRLAFPDVGDEELAEIAAVLETGHLTMGPKVDEFEALLAAATGTRHAAAVSSGTAALHLAVLALGIGEGDEVLVPAYTFPATGNVVALAGARPVLVDVDPVTMNIDPEDAARRATSRTKAVLAVHLFGRPARLEELPDLPVLEDAAGALGAAHRGRPCGSLGVLACFSFHPRKIVTTGEGG